MLFGLDGVGLFGDWRETVCGHCGVDAVLVKLDGGNCQPVLCQLVAVGSDGGIVGRAVRVAVLLSPLVEAAECPVVSALGAGGPVVRIGVTVPGDGSLLERSLRWHGVFDGQGVALL